MSRLIDADALIEIMSKWKFGAISRLDERAYIKETVLELIKAQPTAYSIEKVVAELEKYEEQPMQRPSDIVWNNAINMCLEIVRKGGVE